MESQLKTNVDGAIRDVKVANPKSFRWSDFLLRIVAMATTLVAAIVMGLAKETETIPVTLIPGLAPLLVPVPAKMRYSSAFVYFVVTNAIASAYATFSLLVMIAGRGGPKGLALSITILDVIMVGLLFSGNGAAAAVGLVGYKGNSHVGWKKVCDKFEKFCHHISASVLVSLIGSLVFALIVVLSIFNLHHTYRH